jgi:hypothetical protein
VLQCQSNVSQMSLQCQLANNIPVRFQLALMGFKVGQQSVKFRLRMAKSQAKNATMNLAVRSPVELALGLRMTKSQDKLERLG